MSKNIQEHVVDMRFENKAFESGVSQSLTTIEKLKKSLNFKGMSSGLQDVSTSVKKVDFSTMASSLETLKNRFSGLGAVAFTVIQSITRKLIDVAKVVAKTLLIEPITSGLAEYETQINAIQTILANTAKEGTNLDDVSGALNLLNTYADKTIYNFTEMTRNIGTFTAAGVALQTSVDAIKGIANLAAVSGSTSQQASTAMYQLSQALSTGTLKLQDWNSVVNAGMGGQIFQDALMETARLHGVAIDQMITDEGSFRSTLSSGWLSSEILTDTLKKFTGDLDEATLMHQGYTQTQAAEIVKLGIMANDAATKVKTLTQLGDTLKEAAQSGWTKSWELIIGDFNQAKEFLTQVSDVLGSLIGQSADARNEILVGWGELGGRAYMIDNLWAAFNNLMAIMKPIKEAFSSVFPPMTAETLLKLTVGLGTLINKFKIGAVGAENIKTIFSGFFSLLDIGRLAIVAIGKAISPLFGNLSGFGDGLLSVALSASTYVSALRENITENDLFTNSIAKVVDTLKPYYEGFIAFVDTIKAKLGEFKGLDFSSIKAFFSTLSFNSEPIKKFFAGIGDAFSKFGDITKNVSFDIEPIKDFFKQFLDTIGSFDKDVVFEVIGGAIGSGIMLAVMNLIRNISNAMEGVADTVSGVADMLEGVGGVLKGWQNNLNAKALLSIAFAIAVLAASLFVIASIDSDKLVGALSGLSVLLVDLFAAMKILTGSSANLAGVALGLVAVALALLIMAIAIKKLSTLSEAELIKSVAAISAFLVGLVASVRLMSGATGDVSKAAGSMILMSIALLLLTGSVALLGRMDSGTLEQGLLAVGALLLGLAAFTRLAGGPDNIMGIAVAVGILGLSLLLLVKAVTVFGTMDMDILEQGLLGMGGALAIVAIATQALPKDMVAKGVGLAIVGGALLLLADALKMMGGLDISELEIALAALGISLLMLVVALKLMSGSLTGAAALLIAAGALVVLASALQILGSMSLTEIGIGLLAIAGMFAVFGLAGLILGPMVPVLLALS